MANAYITFTSTVRMYVETSNGEDFDEEAFKNSVLDMPDYFETELAENAAIVKIEKLELDEEEEKESDDEPIIADEDIPF